MKGNVNSDSDSGLSRKQERAISALLYEKTTKEAAEISGVTETTLWRWLKDDAFNKAYVEARRLATSQAIAQIQQAGGDAVKTLCTVMNDTQAPASSRVTAAKTVLELGIKAVELEDMAQRLSELEKFIGIERAEKALKVENKPCRCGRDSQGISPRSVIYFPEDGDEKPSTLCENCGGQMILICVVYDDLPVYLRSSL
jgi:hypothetical protein